MTTSIYEGFKVRSMIQFQADSFIDETGVDALAVCIGNVHGKYPASGPNLRLDLLQVTLMLLLSLSLSLSKRYAKRSTMVFRCSSSEKSFK